MKLQVKLPKVYSDSYALSLNLLKRTQSFPKQFRPTLGRRVEDASLDLCMAARGMLLTNKKSGNIKRSHLQEAVEAVDGLKFLCQVCRDLELISPGGFGEISESLNNVGSQIGGLHHYFSNES